MKKLIAGNWKMNGTVASARALAQDVAAAADGFSQKCDLLLCPPFVHLQAVSEVIARTGAPVLLGAQDCAANDDGPWTGDVSPAMLKDMGCRYVILGHSERRQHHGEKDADVAAKAARAHEKGLITIICVGEKESERDGGYETEVVGSQIGKSLPASSDSGNTVIAYEPVWAIGTGKTASPEDVGRMHSFIRSVLAERLEDSQKVRILYGGSVKPDNAAALFSVPHVDGGLIGGASLSAAQFLDIAKADRRAGK